MTANKISPSQSIYHQHLELINGVRFTPREIDIIACLLSGKGTKTAAQFLSIEEKTVETHKYNIMRKLECNSKESIIDFIEKSDKFSTVKKHYLGLLVQATFEKHLREIFVLRGKVIAVYCLVYWREQKTVFLMNQVERHLKLAGIKILSEVRENHKSLNHLVHHLESQSVEYVIYVPSQTLISQLQSGDSKGKAEVFPFIQKSSKNPGSVIFLLQNKDSYTEISQDIQDVGYVNFGGSENYYFSLLDILQRVLPTINLEKTISGFKKQYEIIYDSVDKAFPQLWTETSHLLVEKIQKKSFFYSLSSTKKIVYLLKCSIFFSGFIILFSALIQHKISQPNTSQKPELIEHRLLVPDNSTILKYPDKIENKTWNLPLSLDYYTQRKELADKVWRTFNEPSEKQTATLTGLRGLGGVGKTTLAAHIIHNPSKSYAFRGWFTAETKDLLRADYFLLGEKYRLFTRDMPDIIKIDIVKEWLENQESSLVVYDNAPDIETIKDFLPNKGHILITSRNYKLPKAIEVDGMTESEALELLSKLVPKFQQAHPYYFKEAKKLVKELGYFPLAISQGGYYIYENGLTIQEYLIHYETCRDRLLRTKSLPPGDQHEPVYITWDINLKAIQNLPNGEQALKLLNFIAYCYPENIPRKLLVHYVYGKVTTKEDIALNSVLNLLRRFSFIKVSPGRISIHRLLHEWIKSKHTETMKLTILRKGAKAIQAIYPWENKKTEDIILVQALVPHTELILSQMQSCTKDTESVDLMSILGNSYHTSGNQSKSKVMLENALTIMERDYAHDHIKLVKALRHLGWIYFELGEYAKAQQAFIRVLDIISKQNKPDQIEVGRVLRNLSWTHLFLGNYAEAKELSERSLKIIKSYYGPHHAETAFILHSLAWAHLLIGDYVTAKEILESALSIRETYYGINHIETSYVLGSLGAVSLYMGDFMKAKRLLESALSIKESHYGLYNQRTIDSLNALGVVHCFLNDFKKSENNFMKSLDVSIKIHGKEHIFTNKARANLGNIYRLLNNSGKSKILLEKSLQFYKSFYGSDNVNVGAVIGNLGLLYGEQGDQTKKSEYLHKAFAIFKKHLHAGHVYIKETIEELNTINGKEKYIEKNNHRPLGYFIIF